jgi:GTPase SAR1 family protein
MDNKTVKLQIWDTGGQERFKYVHNFEFQISGRVWEFAVLAQ